MKPVLLPLVAVVLLGATLQGAEPRPLITPQAVGPSVQRIDGGPRFVGRVRTDVYADTDSIIMVALFPANPHRSTIDNGDELLAINGQFVEGMPFGRYLELFYEAPKGSTVYLDLRSLDGTRRTMTVRVLRAGKMGKYVFGFMKPPQPLRPGATTPAFANPG